MKTSRRSNPEINSGSMADIAFLLLIFFLVTAMIPNDIGIKRKLPELCPPGQKCDTPLKERNVLEIEINSNNELLVEKKQIILSDLKEITKSFLDNNGNSDCTYCHGNQKKDYSENPRNAVISLKNSPSTSYEFYINVQDELTKAYYELRERYAEDIIGKKVNELNKSELKEVRGAYPFAISEAEIR